MFGRQKRKVVNWLESPSKENEKKFHIENIRLSELFWDLADETLLNAIEMGLEQVLTNRSIPGHNVYPNMTDEQIVALFESKKTDLFMTISEDISQPIRERINRLLQDYKGYATQRHMHVPSDNQLTMNQYYYNYKISKEILKLLEIQTYKSR